MFHACREARPGAGQPASRIFLFRLRETSCPGISISIVIVLYRSSEMRGMRLEVNTEIRTTNLTPDLALFRYNSLQIQDQN